ncbi:MAG: hypothetical protein P1V36_00085 [Planctomycetota bacterium]|nr:hypothetical protein [Planctomycetota bacterium]
MRTVKGACSWAQVVGLVIVVGLCGLVLFSTAAYSQELETPAAGVSFAQIKEWAATVVLFAGAAGGVLKLVEWRKNSQQADAAPIKKAHTRIDATYAAIADINAELHPKEESRHLAWRKEVDADRAALKAAVSNLANSSTNEVAVVLRQVQDLVSRLDKRDV